MALFNPAIRNNALRVSRLDPDDPLDSTTERPFTRDEQHWLTAEHYDQGMKYPNWPRFTQVVNAPDTRTVRKMGRSWLKQVRPDWKSIRLIAMTRAIGPPLGVVCRLEANT